MNGPRDNILKSKAHNEQTVINTQGNDMLF